MTVKEADTETVLCVWWPKVHGGEWASEPETATFNPTTLVLLEREGDQERAPQQIRSVTIEIGRMQHYLNIERPLAEQVADILRLGAGGVTLDGD